MKMPINYIRRILIILFVLIGIGGILASIFAIWITAFGIGWGGGNTTLFEIMWDLKGLLLFTGYSITAGYGIIKNKKIGILFGYAATLSLMAYTIYDFGISIKYGDDIKFIEIIAAFFFLTLIGLILFGLYRLMKTIGSLNKQQYLIGGILTSFVILSFVYMFD